MSSTENLKFKLGILLFDEAEVLDFCGPFEVFSIAGTAHNGIFQVVILATQPQITARNGLKIVVDHVIPEDNPKLDILLVPGGFGTRSFVNNETAMAWIKNIAPSLQYILSVCTGVSVLGKCDLIDGLVITTHHMAFDFVGKECPKSKLCKCRRFIDSGRIMTSAGISAGIDLSFHFIKKIYGVEVAESVAKYMEYDWKNEKQNNCTCKY